MSVETTPQKSNRTPWVIAGVLGCLVVCLLIAVGGGAFYLLTQPAATQVAGPAATETPAPAQPTTVAVPTLPPLPTALPSATAPAAQPTLAPQPTSAAQPTVPPLPTLPPLQSGGLPTLAPLTGNQPTAAPVASSKAHLAFTVRRGEGSHPEDNAVWTMNADGSGAKQILIKASEPSFSPDGTQIAYYGWSDGIYVANVDGTNPKKILGEGVSGYLAWSHDGRWIAFSVRPGYSGNIAMDAIAPDGTGRRAITIGWSPFWSPDDSQVVFQTCRGSSCGIYKANSAGGDAVPIVTDDGGLAAWSPDGKKIVYQKDVDGVKQLFLINADGSGKKQLTSGAALHVCANWSLDGNFIFYRSPEGGQWGIWRMNADGSNMVKLANDLPPGDWPYDRIAVGK